MSSAADLPDRSGGSKPGPAETSLMELDRLSDLLKDIPGGSRGMPMPDLSRGMPGMSGMPGNMSSPFSSLPMNDERNHLHDMMQHPGQQNGIGDDRFAVQDNFMLNNSLRNLPNIMPGMMNGMPGLPGMMNGMPSGLPGMPGGSLPQGNPQGLMPMIAQNMLQGNRGGY